MAKVTPSMVSQAKEIVTTPPKNSTAGAVASTNLKPNPVPVKASSTSNMDGAMKAAASEVQNNVTPTTEECTKVVENSEDLVTAIESVATMYGIPPTNVICDDSLDTIRVQGDTIIAPSIDPKGKTLPIMRSIGTVLDYISQRIDDKLNNYQGANIENGIIEDHIKNDSDPSKGKVINRLVDPDGNEILVYDSGLVDMPNTKTAQDFVNRLRADGTIPTVNPSTITEPNSMSKYFADVDDITVDTDAAATPPQQPQGGSDYGDSVVGPAVQTVNNSEDSVDGVDTTDVSAAIGESFNMIELVSKYNNTTHLGYDMLTESGFTGIKPTDRYYVEAASGKKKDIDVTEIKHMKFDNTHLIKAIKYFNEARAEQADIGSEHLDINKLVNSPKWNAAIKELENQFNCHLALHYVKSDEIPEEGGAFTNVISGNNEYKQKCYISKSKGFQLGGLPIDIYFANKFILKESPTDKSLFGQYVCSVMLHEIFHNIMQVLCTYNVEFNAMMTTTVITTSMTQNARVRRKLITNFVNAAEQMGALKLNLVEKRAYIKKMLLICSMRESKKNIELARSLVETGSDSEVIDNYIKQTTAVQNRYEKTIKGGNKMIISSLIGLVLGISMGGTGFVTNKFGLAVAGGILGLGSYVGLKIGILLNKESKKLAVDNSVKNYEEHWCDQFAAMYNLPVHFFSVIATKTPAANMRDDQIKSLHAIEMKWVSLMGDNHPPTTERLGASVKYAQQTLDSGVKLDPSVKKYLEYIVQNHKRILEVEDIDNIFSKNVFDPKTAENLDLHLQNLIQRSNTTITESDISVFLQKSDMDEYY